MIRVLAFALLLAAPAAFIAAPTAARPPSLVPADAPELAAPGALPVGVSERKFDAAPGRTLGLTVFYPAATPGPPTQYTHITPDAPTGFPATLTFEAIASADAAAATGPRLPLVILSHGGNRWSTHMSGIAENLASKGYVVASIDHSDTGWMDPRTAPMAFAAAFIRRSQDQRAAIRYLADFAKTKDPLASRIDPANIAVIGYSMGGFGALATGGAGHARTGAVIAQIPGRPMDSVLEGVKPAPGVRALVLIAPWGGEEKVRSFTPAALSSLTVPSLWIMGDHDDIADTAGIQWLHDQSIRSDRRMLVFANARHNLGGNPPPASAPDTHRLRDAIDEPVWRKDMADAILFRSLTAFLDLTLKNDTAKAAFLDQDKDGNFKGFQPRWQLGLKATHTPPQ